MKLEMARHPCLEVQDDVAFIANDIAFERGMKKSRFSNVFFSQTIFFLWFSISLCGLVYEHFPTFFLWLFLFCFYTGRRQGVFDHHWPKHGRQVHLHQTGWTDYLDL